MRRREKKTSLLTFQPFKYNTCIYSIVAISTTLNDSQLNSYDMNKYFQEHSHFVYTFKQMLFVWADLVIFVVVVVAFSLIKTDAFALETWKTRIYVDFFTILRMIRHSSLAHSTYTQWLFNMNLLRFGDMLECYDSMLECPPNLHMQGKEFSTVVL